MNILIIEDDKDIAELVEYNLRQEKMTAEVCTNGAAGLAKAKKIHPDAIVLDLMLPDVGGLEVCRRLRADPQTQDIPVLMLTAKGTEIDRIVGFEVGADDYLTKPFSPRELVLRVQAVLRRRHDPTEPKASKPLSFGCLIIDPEKFQVKVGLIEIVLTGTEFKFLYYLLSTKGKMATRDVLLDRVWGYSAEVTTRTIDTHVKRLRQKLGCAGDYIETVRGVGYRFKEKP